MRDHDAMRAALALARRGLGRVWPNPAVGCVIVKDGRVVGRGWTQPGGRPHAEAMALAQAGAAARGATAFVTLEPCAHHGRTPPCADALAAAGVARVVSPMEDPDPRVSGRGFARLREAGAIVDVGLMAQEAAETNKGFLTRQRLARPMLTLKLAATLDGRIATQTGESRWITGPAARAEVHGLRARSDGLLIGAGTMRADDPSLDVRLPGLEDRGPLRIIAAPDGQLPPASKLARTAAAAPVLLCHGRGGAKAASFPGVRTIPVERDENGLDPQDLLFALGREGLTRILCEGGGALAASLLKAGLVDELIWMTAGAAVGAEGRSAIGGLALERLTAAPRFTLVETRRLGADVMTVWRPQRQSHA